MKIIVEILSVTKYINLNIVFLAYCFPLVNVAVGYYVLDPMHDIKTTFPISGLTVCLKKYIYIYI